MLPPYWETRQLAVRNVREGDTDALLALFNANHAVEKWDPTFKPIERPEMAQLVANSLASSGYGGRPFQMQCFEERKTDRIVGYYHATYGLPHPDVFWFGMFVLHPDATKRGYAREVVDGLYALWFILPEQTRAWAEVWLKNWPALRFWINVGFTTIIEWEGASVLAEGTNASIILERRWRGRASAI